MTEFMVVNNQLRKFTFIYKYINKIGEIEFLSVNKCIQFKQVRETNDMNDERRRMLMESLRVGCSEKMLATFRK